MHRQFSAPFITQLAPNEIFVFGSNEAGIHGAGAAALAHQEFGAEMGVGVGPTGQCYALPTKDRQIQTLPLGEILSYVQAFLVYIRTKPEKCFMVTALGTGLAGLSPHEIAPMFFHSQGGWIELPPNAFLPASFWDAMKTFPDFTLYDN